MNRCLMCVMSSTMGILFGLILATCSMMWSRTTVPEGKTWALYEFDGPLFDMPEDGRYLHGWNQGDRIHMETWRSTDILPPVSGGLPYPPSRRDDP